jgi:hypothetical protein
MQQSSKRQSRLHNGIHVAYSPVNQAWFVMWCDLVLSIHNSKADALYEANRLSK